MREVIYGQKFQLGIHLKKFFVYIYKKKNTS